LKIVLVTETYPPEIGGAAMCIRRFEEELLSRGHEVQVVRPRQQKKLPGEPPPGRSEIFVRGIPVPLHGGLQLGLPARRVLEADWRLRRPDLVHIASEWLLGGSALSAARRLALPVTTSFHTNFHQYGTHYRFGWLSRPVLLHLRRFHSHGERTLVPTPQLREHLASQGFRRLVVVPRGVDTGLFNPRRRCHRLRRSFRAGPRTLLALYAGRLAPEKNVPLAVASFRKLQETEPDARMVLVGDGPERPRLARENPDLVFTGLLRGEELARHYASADVFLFPSLTETFGNVVLEAMASGLAVVAFDDAAARQHLRNQDNGVLVPGRAAEPFLRAVQALGRDRWRIPELAAGAVATARGISWDRVGDILEGVLVRAVCATREPRLAHADASFVPRVTSAGGTPSPVRRLGVTGAR
jgi:glycosyltransferase involved in cell wall biosynthesis